MSSICHARSTDHLYRTSTFWCGWRSNSTKVSTLARCPLSSSGEMCTNDASHLISTWLSRTTLPEISHENYNRLGTASSRSGQCLIVLFYYFKVVMPTHPLVGYLPRYKYLRYVLTYQATHQWKTDVHSSTYLFKPSLASFSMFYHSIPCCIARQNSFKNSQAGTSCLSEGPGRTAFVPCRHRTFPPRLTFLHAER